MEQQFFKLSYNIEGATKKYLHFMPKFHKFKWGKHLELVIFPQ
jgi:hypothetical protein